MLVPRRAHLTSGRCSLEWTLDRCFPGRCLREAQLDRSSPTALGYLDSEMDSEMDHCWPSLSGLHKWAASRLVADLACPQALRFSSLYLHCQGAWAQPEKLEM